MTVVAEAIVVIVRRDFVAIQRTMLTSNELATIFFIHRTRTYRAIGFPLSGDLCEKTLLGLAVIRMQSRPRLLTSVVLLLLMIIAQLALTLRCHPALSLHHLLGLTRTGLVTLCGIEVLQVGRRVRPQRVVLGYRVMSLRDTSSHALVWGHAVRGVLSPNGL